VRDQRLERSSHATVAVAERVHHHQIQMGHGRPEQDREIATVQLGERVANEARDVFVGGALIHDLAVGIAPDPGRAGTPAAGILREIVLDHHEVHRLKKSLVDAAGGILRVLEDIGHGIAVARHGQRRLHAGVQGLLAFDGRDDVVQGCDGIWLLDVRNQRPEATGALACLRRLRTSRSRRKRRAGHRNQRARR